MTRRTREKVISSNSNSEGNTNNMVNKNNDNDVLASSENMDQEETTAGYGMKKTRILYDNKKETAAGI